MLIDNIADFYIDGTFAFVHALLRATIICLVVYSIAKKKYAVYKISIEKTEANNN